MHILRRLGSAATAGLLMTAFVSGPAGAQTAEVYVGNANGRVLALQVGTLLPQVSLGTTSALADSTLKAVAESAGALGLPLLSGSNAGKVEVNVDGAVQFTGEQCATPALPAPIDSVLSIGVACSTSAAKVENGNPHATGVAQIARVEVDAADLLQPITSVADPLLTGLLGGTLDTINNTLPAAVPDLQIGDTLGDVLAALGAVKTLDVQLGTSTSDVAVEGGVVTSTATSAGGIVSVLPLGVAGLKPVVEIEIGSAKATAVYDRSAGTSAPAFDPSIVTVRINTPTTDALGQLVQINPQEIKIGPNLALPVLGALASPCADAANEYCLLPGTPFETRIAVASGRTVTNPDGSVGAVADAVKIHALRNIGQLLAPLEGGILLEIAGASAGVAGARPTVVVETPRELPRTGGTPWVAILGAGTFAAAIIGRRALARVPARTR